MSLPDSVKGGSRGEGLHSITGSAKGLKRLEICAALTLRQDGKGMGVQGLQ